MWLSLSTTIPRSFVISVTLSQKNCIYLVVGVRSVSKEPHQHAQLITGLHVKVFDPVLYV